MKFTSRLTVFFLLVCLGSAAYAEDSSLTAADIMARVAANQDRSDKLRAEYLYHQHIHIVTRKANKKLIREESTDYLVIPTPDGTKKELKLITGRYWHKGRYVEFKHQPAPEPDSMDADLIKDFRNDTTNEQSKDGLARDYFPLTTDEQKKFQFRLLGKETLQGREVYHLSFGPLDKKDYDWAGEAFIDATEFQPVTVFTKLSRQLPFLVRELLVDLPGIGFNVQYRRQPDGVWFPSTFGTEFRLRVLAFIARDISISLENTDFEHTHVETKMKVEAP
jgi:hypothetical protein